MRQATLALCFTFGMAANIDQLQIGSDATQRFVRREALQPGAASLAETAAKRDFFSDKTPATCEFDNGGFEKVTLATDNVGITTYTHQMTANTPVTASGNNLDDWTASGTVIMVPSGCQTTCAATIGCTLTPNTGCASTDTPSGGQGVFLALKNSGTQISQVVSGHTVGGNYALAFAASSLVGAPEMSHLEIILDGASTQDVLGHHVNGAGNTVTNANGGNNGNTGAASGEPDWDEDLQNTWADYYFVYQASQADVTVTIKNNSPTDPATCLVDAFEIAACGTTHGCS